MPPSTLGYQGRSAAIDILWTSWASTLTLAPNPFQGPGYTGYIGLSLKASAAALSSGLITVGSNMSFVELGSNDF